MDVTAVAARLRFECRARAATAEATVGFTSDGRPAVFDLRQRIRLATLDGKTLDPLRLAPRPDG
ncbi:MAG TPA: hypothetical protein VFO65_12065, partial [Acidimicrobiales bacterium]|nr:hypothetical protein [Acidimicrobiales bacterium]